jgi:hypothetical protein
MSLSTSLFTFNPTTKTFVAELSELPGGKLNVERGLRFGKFVDTITLESHLTGKEVQFFLETVDRTPDGEVAGYRFAVLGSTDRFKLLGVNVLIIND